MSKQQNLNAHQALLRLEEGNRAYMEANTSTGNISPAVRKETAENGQSPYAIIVTCSDSRVIPESIFNAGIGDLFVIRVAGNVIDKHQLASIEYAQKHLGTRLIVVMGHTHCGAVEAAMHPDEDCKFIQSILEEIRSAIGDESDERAASILNVRHSIHRIENSFEILASEEENGLDVTGAIYDTETGKVEFLD
ncbi:MAG: carbonic anhydrase [Eubacterium sp.]|jgi:carbonic anhydrase|nr:carbonic anhydrase [Eubacterium sp.]MCH4047256.1 carbonic anhydrase [Eubacterium sp.]MCH4080351.1 carbonic anhydrase [Eubacterium sp.]MCH4110600.1 carbonic anhydrase [Eubacterium sp.]MCI1307325.1 carbonic anhydrase [Eubacterium sp.]